MKYRIGLSLRNSYGGASSRVRTLVHLLPLDVPGRQTVHSANLRAKPVASEQQVHTDFFGNATTMLVYHAPMDQIDLRLEAVVSVQPGDAALDLSCDLDAMPDRVAASRNLGPRAPQHFLGASPRVPVVADITAFARHVLRPGLTARASVERIGEALHGTLRFDATATDVTTPPSEAFAKRHGVCQDFSHVMIAALRGVGIPAGYVSGFLRTLPPPGQPRLAGADAMHAWVCAWCGPEQGWVEYDPTNACFAGTDHVVVAYGRDYGDVAPVRGVILASGTQSSRHSVDVVPIEDKTPADVSG